MELVEEIFLFLDDLNGMDQSDFFLIDNDLEVIFDDESCEFLMFKVFEDEIKFCFLVLENLVKFIKMGCIQKVDVIKYFDEIKVFENCKNLVLLFINLEIWNNLYVNVQQRDKII